MGFALEYPRVACGELPVLAYSPLEYPSRTALARELPVPASLTRSVATATLEERLALCTNSNLPLCQGGGHTSSEPHVTPAVDHGSYPTVTFLSKIAAESPGGPPYGASDPINAVVMFIVPGPTFKLEAGNTPGMV